MAFAPQLTTTDWNEEWKELQRTRRRPDDPAAWDARAKDFPTKHGSQEGYVGRFLELAALHPGESVLDMGCGTGALATPLAQAGHSVIACDFSRGMLDAMEADQRSLGVSHVKALQMSWADDWEKQGVGPKSVDVALASRSIATTDLRASLLKLTAAARRRCCITVPCGPSPRIDQRLLQAAGLSARVGNDFLYAFNILAGLGFHPEVAYIPSSRREIFATFDEALSGFSTMVRDAAQGCAAEDELAEIPARLAPWLEDHLEADEEGLHLSPPREITWAFLAWSPQMP